MDTSVSLAAPTPPTDVVTNLVVAAMMVGLDPNVIFVPQITQDLSVKLNV